MAGMCSSFARHMIRSSLVRTPRPPPSFSARISARSSNLCDELALPEGPSCIFVGPIETASKETLEALYRQARDAYYSGKPLIKDYMFDRVELKLRRYGSKSVVKYPRCSLRRQSAYAEAEVDPSQAFALASIWIVIFAFGCSACLMPIFFMVYQAYEGMRSSGISYGVQESAMQGLAMANSVLFVALGSVIGIPIATASVGVLQGLWRNDLVALKGACPNCGEEVFAFVRSDQSNSNLHKATCHVCESSLEFGTKVEQSSSRLGRKWVHGCVYLERNHSRKKLF